MMSGIVIEDATVVMAKILDAYAAFLLYSIANSVPIAAVGQLTDSIIDKKTISEQGIHFITKNTIMGKIIILITEIKIALKSLMVSKNDCCAIVTPATSIGNGVFIKAT